MTVIDVENLRRRVADVPSWYHVLELTPDVVTPGEYDMRPFVDAYRLPESLEGCRACDVGASNGFFSFELERRGATVVAVDLRSVADHDAPRWYRERWLAQHDPDEIARIDRAELEAGFALAHDVLRSTVQKQRCHVNELGAAMPSEFDLVFCSNLMHHLRDPVLALESMREALVPGGQLILSCPCDTSHDASYAIFDGSTGPGITWFTMSPEALVRMCHMAGFEDVAWRGSFELASRSRPDDAGTQGVVHATAP